MGSDYEAITRRNVSELGTKTSTRKTQICMYSDLTHFVYEFLQNADDYGASEVRFALMPNQVVVEHNGTPFTPQNVNAITSFGESTSRDDMLKSGRFGVGFKSVFAFTATPAIISGNEHFKIHGLYRVSEYPYPDDLPRGRTRIILPFDHEVEKPDYVEDLMPAVEAYTKILDRLTGLNMHTLLFTRNVRAISWEADGSSGNYVREDTKRGDGRYTTVTDGKTLSKYLVFSRTPRWRGQSYKDVEIAFGLDDNDQISTIQDSLYVLFATTQETHLQFILNGPYKTNPSRETISEEDSFNRHLMKETCELLGAILPHLRDSGLLTTQFLGVLPNASDDLRPFYEPLLATVVKCFQSEALVPTDDDRFASAQQVFQGPAVVREVIRPAELGFFGQAKVVRWAKGVVQNTRPDQFLKGLEIKQWGYAELQEALESKYGGYYEFVPQSKSDIAWLAARIDEWLRKLYILLAEAIRKNDCDESEVQRFRIVRVTEDKEQNHVSGRNAHFPKGGVYRDLPQVKRTILKSANKIQQKRIEEALVALGVTEIGDEERIDLLLSIYYSEDSDPVGRERHLQDMKFFVRWWKKTRNASKFKGHSIFRLAGPLEQREGGECYLDVPLRASNLTVIYAGDYAGVRKRHKLWTRYRTLLPDGFCDFAVACGVADKLPIAKRPCGSHPLWNDMRDGLSGTRETSTQIDVDYYISQMEALLDLKKRDVNLLIWKTLSKADPKILAARYRPNRQYLTRRKKSSLVLGLSHTEWIPDKKGTLRRPAEVTKEDLHPSFRYDNRNGWLDEIGFGENARRQTEEYKQRQSLAQKLGLRSEIVDLLDDLPENERADVQKQFEALLKRRSAARKKAERLKQTELPFHEALAGALDDPGIGGEEQVGRQKGASRNPSRRRRKLQEEIAATMADEPSPETRFTYGVCKKWKGKNDVVRQKLIHWYEGQCQMCGKTFLQRNGEPYFEGLYLVPYTEAEWIDRPGNVLCLCPWHSAMIQFGSKRLDTDISAELLAFVPQACGGDGQPAISLTLCGVAESIKFHEDHFIELKVMIQESEKAQC